MGRRFTVLYLVAPAQQHRKSVNSIRVAILSQNFTDTMAEDDDCSTSRRSTNSINNDASPWTLTRPPWTIYTEPHLGGCRRSYWQCWKRNPLSAISSIWDDEYCDLCIENDKDAWKWKRCGKTFRPRHVTRAVSHFAMIANKGMLRYVNH